MTHEQLQDAHIAALREIVELKATIDEQVEENRGLRRDVLLMQKANAEQRAEIERLKTDLDMWRHAAQCGEQIRIKLKAQLATAKGEVWARINDRMETKCETKEDLREWVREQKELRFSLEKLERMKVVHNTMLKQAAVKQDDIQQMVKALGDN